jgi:transposase InsO family protein
MLDAHGITCSMSRTGDCYDNAVMEACFSTVKTELGDRFESCGEAKMQLFDYIEVFLSTGTIPTCLRCPIIVPSPTRTARGDGETLLRARGALTGTAADRTRS